MDIRDMANKAFDHAYDSGFHEDHPHDVLEELGYVSDAAIRNYLMVKLALIVTEATEAMDEVRSNDDPLESYYREDGKPEGLASELADIIVRTGDLAASFEIDLEAAVIEKMAYNKSRPAKHGKHF